MADLKQPPVMRPASDADVQEAARAPRPRIERKSEEVVDKSKESSSAEITPEGKLKMPPANPETASTTEKIPATELKTGEEKKPGEEKPADKPVDKKALAAEKAKAFAQKKKPAAEIKAGAEVTEAKPAVIPKEMQAEYETFKKENQELKAIIEDPDVQIILEAKKSGKDVFAVMKEVEGVDPNTLTKEQLYELACKNNGLEGDELEDAMDDFRLMKPYQQTAATVEIKEKLKGDAGQKKLNFLSKLKEGSAQTSAEQKKQEDISLRLQQDLNALADDFIGKTDEYDLVGTPQMAESIKNIVKDGLIGRNQDGSLNAGELFELAKFRLFKEKMVEELRASSYLAAYEELEKEFAATGGNTQMVRMSQGTQEKTDQEKAKSSFDAAQPVR